jgi:hypothetical protein
MGFTMSGPMLFTVTNLIGTLVCGLVAAILFYMADRRSISSDREESGVFHGVAGTTVALIGLVCLICFCVGIYHVGKELL